VTAKVDIQDMFTLRLSYPAPPPRTGSSGSSMPPSPSKRGMPCAAGPRRGPDERDPSPRGGDNNPDTPSVGLLLHTLAHLPNLGRARCVAERSTFANVRRT
jgi:hypothetical protein